MLQKLNSERGHVGPTVASLVAIAAGIVGSLGIGFESKAMQIVGVGLFAFAIVAATQVPHLWIRKVWRRVDRMTDESDPDRHTSFRIEL